MRRTMLWAMMLASLCCLLVPDLVGAQPGGGRGGRGGRGGPGGFGDVFGGGLLGLAQQRDVQREIELSDDQRDEIQTLGGVLRDEIRSEMQDLFQNMRDMSDEERAAARDQIAARMAEIQKDVEGRVGQVLMPHQLDRLKQIDIQARIQRNGAAALSDGELAEALGISDAQKEQLQERAEQVQQDLQEKINQLRIDARNQLLEVLTTEQRAKLEAMMGAQFELRDAGPGGRGGRGGRGGGN